MSTKIYTGYLWKGKMSDLYEYLVLLRENIKSKNRNQIYDYIYRKMLTEEKQYVYDYINDLEKEKNSMMRGYLDFLSGFVSIFCVKHNKKEYIGLYFGNISQKEMIKHKNLKYFGYWNNTDPDEDCSSKEWKMRQVLWEKFIGDDVISTKSSTFEIYNDSFSCFNDIVNQAYEQVKKEKEMKREGKI